MGANHTTRSKVFAGCGGNTSKHTSAALKVQVRLDLVTGALAGPLLQAGRANDGRAPTQTLPLPSGALRLADLGYFNLAVLRDVHQQAGYWRSRLEARSVVVDPDGTRWAMDQLLATQASPGVDLPVQVADERRRKLRATARRKQVAPSAASLAMADWTVFITTASYARLSPTPCRCRRMPACLSPIGSLPDPGPSGYVPAQSQEEHRSGATS